MVSQEQWVLRAAETFFQKEPDWASFFRDVFGQGGIVEQAFPKEESQTAFKQTEEFGQIQLMLSQLRQRSRLLPRSTEATKVMTVRLPESVYEALRIEAGRLGTSMNKLCISKLLQMVEESLVPPVVRRRRELEKEEAASSAERDGDGRGDGDGCGGLDQLVSPAETEPNELPARSDVA